MQRRARRLDSGRGARIDGRDERVHGRFLGAAEHIIKDIGLNRSAVMRLCPPR
jgi:hypothetical protein